MTPCEVLTSSTAANCHGCKRRVEAGLHYCDKRLYCGHCCPEHGPPEPLPGGGAKPAGVQGILFAASSGETRACTTPDVSETPSMETLLHGE